VHLIPGLSQRHLLATSKRSQLELQQCYEMETELSQLQEMHSQLQWAMGMKPGPQRLEQTKPVAL
jgi:hypothetical protein